MKIWQSDEQVALQDLAVAVQHSADQYADAAAIVEVGPAADAMSAIARQREQWAEEIRQAIRQTDDLPSVPNQDKEDGEKLFNRMKAAFAEDGVAAVLQQRLDEEKQVHTLLADCRTRNYPQTLMEVIRQLETHVEQVEQQLQNLIAHH